MQARISLHGAQNCQMFQLLVIIISPKSRRERVKDVRAKLYWIYRPRNLKECKVRPADPESRVKKEKKLTLNFHFSCGDFPYSFPWISWEMNLLLLLRDAGRALYCIYKLNCPHSSPRILSACMSFFGSAFYFQQDHYWFVDKKTFFASKVYEKYFPLFFQQWLESAWSTPPPLSEIRWEISNNRNRQPAAMNCRRFSNIGKVSKDFVKKHQNNSPILSDLRF